MHRIFSSLESTSNASKSSMHIGVCNDNKNKSSLTSKKYMNHVLISMENETNLLAFENILNADIDKLLKQQEQETIDTYLLEDNND